MAKRKNRAATEQELGLITDIQPDARMNDHHDQHNNANKAIIDLYEALDIDIDGNTGQPILGTDFGNTVPDPLSADAGKVLATDGTDYGWEFVDSANIKLSNAPGSPFGISDDPNYANATNQAQANALFVRYITENEEAVKELAIALGLELNVDANGDITINVDPNGTNPSLDDKFDAKDANGDAPSTLTNAKDMEDAIDTNRADIDNLVVNLGGTVNPDGSIDIDIDIDTSGLEADIAQNTADIAQKFDKDVQGGAGPATYTTALSMENAIEGNASSIGDLNQKVADLTQEIIDGNAEINVDVATKLDRGNTNYANAEAIESAVTTLETNKADVNHNHDLDYATKDELSAEAAARDAGDTQAVADANAYTDNAVSSISVDTSDLATKAELTAEETARIAGDNALDARVTQNETDIAAIVVPNVSDFTTKTYVDAADATKFDKGATSYSDAKAMEDAIDAISTSGGYNDAWIQPAIDTKFDKGTTSYSDARAMEDAIGTNSSNISSLEQQFDSLVTDGIDGLEVELTSYLKKGNSLVAGDAKELEDKINANTQAIDDLDIPVIDDLATKTEVADGDAATLAGANSYTDTEVAKKLDKGATSYSDAKEIQDAIEGIVVPDVSGLATKDELATGLAGKADEPHTHADLAAGDHTHDITDVPHDHDLVYQPLGDYSLDTHTHDTTHDHNNEYQAKGDYATSDDLTNGLAGKSDTTHTHDTTHNHDGTYQPAGDYATKTELNVVDGKADANTTKNTEQDGKIAALEAGQLVQDGKIDANATKNTEQDGKISALENKVDSLENLALVSKYEAYPSLALQGRGGAILFDDEDISLVQAVSIARVDKDGVSHKIEDIGDGDILTVASATWTAVYTLSSGGPVDPSHTSALFSATFESGSGTIGDGEIVDVKVQKAFDPSSYVTQSTYNEGMAGKVSVGNDVVNDQYACTSIVALTKADYDGLATKSPTTMYLVVG